MFLKCPGHWPLLLLENRYILHKIIIVKVGKKKKRNKNKGVIEQNYFEKRKTLAISSGSNSSGSGDYGISRIFNGNELYDMGCVNFYS